MKSFILFVFSILALSTTSFAQKSNKGGTKGYDKIGSYNRKGWAKVEKNGKVGYIDRSGVEVIECVYDQIYPFDKGRAKMIKNGKFGLVNENGEVFVDAKYDYIGPFVNGLAIVTVNNKRGLINEQGEEVVEVE